VKRNTTIEYHVCVKHAINTLWYLIDNFKCFHKLNISILAIAYDYRLEYNN